MKRFSEVLALVGVLVLLVTGISTSEARGLAELEGSYTGAFLYSQGHDIRVVGTTTIKVVSKASGKSGKILITGKIGENDFRSKIILKGRKFVMTSLLPGQFSQRVSGKAKAGQKFVEFSADFSGKVTGKGKWRIGFDSFGEILDFSGIIIIDGGTPVFVNFTAG